MMASSVSAVGPDTFPSAQAGDDLLVVRDLRKSFGTAGGFIGRQSNEVQAVAGVSFEVRRRETLGLVGESGCGKTTLGRTVLLLERPSSGSIVYDGRDVTLLSQRGVRRLRRQMQLIFQDPYSSLNPRMTAAQIIGEPLDIHEIGSGTERVRRIAELLDLVGLGTRSASRYPHEFSGGQRQRVGIARALAVNPAFVVCDEPVSALDVSIQAQVLNLLTELRDRLGLTYLFISHNLGVVKHIANRVAVMYLGQIVEMAPVGEFFDRACHPYSKALLSAIPIPDPDLEQTRQHVILTGDLPSPANPPKGCRFHTRCPFVQQICREEEPAVDTVAAGHTVSCHFWRSIKSKAEVSND
jgi:oligopeptide/dipeptide ABC transporter ATP-binding protein